MIDPGFSDRARKNCLLADGGRLMSNVVFSINGRGT